MSYKHFEWKSEYSVNDDTLDEQHKNFLSITNEIFDLAEKQDPCQEDVLVLLTKLGNNILYHFDFEEKYLKKLNFPKLEEHMDVHKKYRKEIQDFIQEVREGNRDIRETAGKVATFVYDWVSRHMLGSTDTKKFFAEKRQETQK